MQLFTLALLSSLLALASAQFQFFEQMFNQGGQQQQQHRQPEKQNVPSDSEWYQRNHEAGTIPPPPLSPLLWNIADPWQHTAPTTSAPAPSPASTSHTTAPAPSQPSKTRSNSGTGARCASVKADGKRGRRRGRSGWRGRGCCEELFHVEKEVYNTRLSIPRYWETGKRGGSRAEIRV